MPCSAGRKFDYEKCECETEAIVNCLYICPTRQTKPPVSSGNNTIQYNTIQYNTIQCNTIQYNTIQYNTIQYNTIQYNTIYDFSPL
jgi:hypothetical protein